MIKIKYIYLILIGVVLFSGTVRASEIKRIVSLAPSLTKNLQYLESEDRLVGCTSYCQTSSKVEVVASALKVNIEKVVTMKPDLVIATTITNTETIEVLRKFGIRVEVFPRANSFDDICTQFLSLGEIIGKEDQALKVVGDCKKRVDELKKTVKSTQKLKIFLQIGADPLYTVIPNTFMADYITYAGAQNIASDLTIGSITRESVLLRNPDVIFIVTMGIVGEDEKATWEKIKELNATKNKKIFIIDSDKACTPTPFTFVETLETIINLTYGK
jgi:ABC-type Fe3+-hydroxamate transport system substrate-binding protein